MTLDEVLAHNGQRYTILDGCLLVDGAVQRLVVSSLQGSGTVHLLLLGHPQLRGDLPVKRRCLVSYILRSYHLQAGLGLGGLGAGRSRAR